MPLALEPEPAGLPPAPHAFREVDQTNQHCERHRADREEKDPTTGRADRGQEGFIEIGLADPAKDPDYEG